MTKREQLPPPSGYVYDHITTVLTLDAPLPKSGVTALRDILDQPREIGIEPAAAGIVLHGAVHFWQLFASGYVANIVAGEWERLIQFENNGTIASAPAHLIDLYNDATDASFSAAQLQETWARFWEAWMILDDIDRHCHAMTEGPDAAIYARPYAWLLEILDGNAVLAALVFPSLCFHAFGTTHPVQVFCSTARRAAQSKAIRALSSSLTYDAVQDGWLQHWNALVNEAIVPVLVQRGDSQGLRGIELIQSGALRAHPIYSEYLEYWVALQQAWRQTERATDEAPVVSQLVALRQFSNDIWLVFAMPGHPWCRAVLSHYLPIPMVIARDGVLAARRPANLRLRESRAGVSRVSDTYRQHALALTTRAQRFRAACRAASLGLPADAFAI